MPHGAVHNLVAQRAEFAHRRFSPRLHLVVPAVLDQQNPFPLAQWPDNLAGEPQHGRLGGGAVAHHQRPAALGQPLHHLPQRRAGQPRLPLHQVWVDRDGLLFAHIYTKVYDHVLNPLMTPDRPNAPPELAQALDLIDQIVAGHITKARVPTAA